MGERDIELTDEERRAIAALKRLAKRWPKTLWLFSAGGTLCVMRAGPDGDAVRRPGVDGEDSIDPANVVDTVRGIITDGGDW